MNFCKDNFTYHNQIYLQTISISCKDLLLFLIKNNYTFIFHLYRFIEM